MSTPVSALTRIALVIGNSGYVNEPRLTNPSRDAKSVADALRKIGFQSVNLVIDANVGDFNHALQAFQDQSLGADIAVLYYAGHGMELNGTNYLIPVDAKLATDRDLSFEAVTQDLAQQAAGGAKLLSLVILDACRDDPFASTMTITSGAHRGLSRGLAPVKEDQLSVNSIVEYSAESGTLASDGAPGAANSPFATAFLDHVVEPGVEITLLFGKVRDDVWKATDQGQRPASYGSHGGDPVYIVPAATGDAALQAPKITVTTDEEPRISPELVDWQAVVVSSDPSTINAYLNTYPRAEYASVARHHLALLAASKPDATGAVPNPPAFGYGAPPRGGGGGASPASPRSDVSAEAEFSVAVRYLNGEGVTKDNERAKALLTAAAKRDHVLAEYTLGGVEFAAGDYGDAWQLYRLAADQGYAPAQTALGYMNWAGLGMVQDRAEALRWHRKAAAAGIAASIGNVGWFYAVGAVVPQDVALAAKWDQLAADRGDTAATANLGLLYFQGRGVERDIGKARVLMTTAAQANNGVALAWLKLNPAPVR